MTNRDYLLRTNKDAEFLDYLILDENKLIEDQVICGYIPHCSKINCLTCQKNWLNANYKQTIEVKR